MGVGIWIMVYKSDYKSLLDSDIYVIVPGLMIAAGVVVIIVAIVGCVGAAKENRFFLISVSNLCMSLNYGILYTLCLQSVQEFLAHFKNLTLFILQFLVMVILIFILELTIGILAFVYSSKVMHIDILGKCEGV